MNLSCGNCGQNWNEEHMPACCPHCGMCSVSLGHRSPPVAGNGSRDATQWEYQVEQDIDLSPFYVNTILKEFGLDGWELISAAPVKIHFQPDRYTLVFKRPVKETP